jgi:hypothetical protein
LAWVSEFCHGINRALAFATVHESHFQPSLVWNVPRCKTHQCVLGLCWKIIILSCNKWATINTVTQFIIQTELLTAPCRMYHFIMQTQLLTAPCRMYQFSEYPQLFADLHEAYTVAKRL